MMGKEEHKVKAKRHTPNQVIRKLREAELMLADKELEILAHKEISRGNF